MNYIMQNYEMDKNGVFRHKVDESESNPMENFVISKQKYREMSMIESFLIKMGSPRAKYLRPFTLILLDRPLSFKW